MHTFSETRETKLIREPNLLEHLLNTHLHVILLRELPAGHQT